MQDGILVAGIQTGQGQHPGFISSPDVFYLFFLFFIQSYQKSQKLWDIGLHRIPYFVCLQTSRTFFLFIFSTNTDASLSSPFFAIRSARLNNELNGKGINRK